MIAKIPTSTASAPKQLRISASAPLQSNSTAYNVKMDITKYFIYLDKVEMHECGGDDKVNGYIGK